VTNKQLRYDNFTSRLDQAVSSKRVHCRQISVSARRPLQETRNHFNLVHFLVAADVTWLAPASHRVL